MIRLYAQSNIKYFFRFSNMSLNQFFTAINTTICNRDCKSHVSLYPCLSFSYLFFIYFQWNFTGICNSFKKQHSLKEREFIRVSCFECYCLFHKKYFRKKTSQDVFFPHNFMNEKFLFEEKTSLWYIYSNKSKSWQSCMHYLNLMSCK